MELRHLRYFVTVIAEGSLHGASRKLNIAQPALSRRLMDLEAELGVALLFRSAKGVRPTPAGVEFLEKAKAALAGIEQASERARDIGAGRAGPLRFACAPLAVQMRFPLTALVRVREQSPAIRPQISVLRSGAQVPALLGGRFDLGVLYQQEPANDQLSYLELRTHRLVLAVPADHPLAGRSDARVVDLQGSKLLRAPNPLIEGYLQAACHRSGIAPLVVHPVENEAARLCLVAAGWALSLTNSSILDRRPPEGIAFVPIEDLDLKLTLAAVWPKGTETPLLRGFLDALSEASAAEHA